MKIRNIPYGYQYENGTIVLAIPDSAVVKEIYFDYVSGCSMLEIATKLNLRSVEYRPGVIGWNKARIKRILEDRRYLGTERFPEIIEHGTYILIQSVKECRNTQAGTDRRAGIFQLDVPIYCPMCGGYMKRYVNKGAKVPHRWMCSNKSCKYVIGKNDTVLLGEITELLNQLISDPSMICIERSASEPTMELRRVENEIGRLLDMANFDKNVLREKIIACVSRKYAAIDPKPYTAQRLRATFEQAGLIPGFSPDLFRKTVKYIHFELDETVSITLTNDQRIRKEAAHHADAVSTSAEDRAGYPGNG